MKDTLQKMKDNLAESVFGMTVKETHASGICIECRQQALPRCYSEAGRREYRISGLCEQCFDKITGGKDEED